MKKVILFFLISHFISCNQKMKYFKKFYQVDTLTIFSLNEVPYEQLKIRNDCKVDSFSELNNFIKKDCNYDVIYFYKNIDIRNNISIFTLYSNWDYYEDIILVTERKMNKYEKKVISTISGDGGDFYFKKSEYKNGVFYSNFVGGERTLTSPIDTIKYRIKGKSVIKILPDGKISEDTIKIKRNFIELVPEDYVIDENF